MAAFIVWTVILAMLASLAIIIEKLVKLIAWIYRTHYNKTHYKRRA